MDLTQDLIHILRDWIIKGTSGDWKRLENFIPVNFFEQTTVT